MDEQAVLKAAQVTPSERQLAWQETEFYAFIHFGINTFTDREWGTGNEDPAIFNPEQCDPEQWVRTCQMAGMRGLILTCKHHDGFCLWPSRYTDYTVARSPWKAGKGDLVQEVADACRKRGIKFGIYLSPWDRHEPSYGDSPAYNAFFANQLRELLTGYGEIFCVWFDGACGEGPNGKKQIYDWDAYYRLIREYQPNAVISVCGPDVRWCGNEAGHTRRSEWSVVPAHLKDVEKIQAQSQQEDDRAFARRIHTQDEDLGSREVIAKHDQLIWYPAEVNTSIRPGWFYHPAEDDQVKSLDELLKVYYGSVGGNANFLLNVPPDKRGLIHEHDAARLKQLGDALRDNFRVNLAEHAEISFTLPTILIDMREMKSFNSVVLQECIRAGQRVERFILEYREEDNWVEMYQGTVIGYKRICTFDTVVSRYVRLTILESRWHPMFSSAGVYHARQKPFHS